MFVVFQQYVLSSSFNYLNPLQNSQPYATTTVSSSLTGWICSSSSFPLVQSFSYSEFCFGTQSTSHQLQGTHANLSSFLAQCFINVYVQNLLASFFFSSGQLLISLLQDRISVLVITPHSPPGSCSFLFLWPQSVFKFLAITLVLFPVVNMPTLICCSF